VCMCVCVGVLVYLRECLRGCVRERETVRSMFCLAVRAHVVRILDSLYGLLCVLQCVAVRVAVCCSVLQCAAVRCSVLEFRTHCNAVLPKLQCVAE